MYIVFQTLKLIFLTIKLVMMVYSGWKFLSGDKKNNATLWYEIMFVAMLV